MHQCISIPSETRNDCVADPRTTPLTMALNVIVCTPLLNEDTSIVYGEVPIGWYILQTVSDVAMALKIQIQNHSMLAYLTIPSCYISMSINNTDHTLTIIKFSSISPAPNRKTFTWSKSKSNGFNTNILSG